MIELQDLIDKHERRAAYLEKELRTENTFISELRSLKIQEPDIQPEKFVKDPPVKKVVKNISTNNPEKGAGKLKTLEFIRKAGRVVSIDEIMKGTGFSRYIVSTSHIHLLKKEGLIVRAGYGKWQASTKPKTPTERKLNEIEEEEIEIIPPHKPEKKKPGMVDMDDFKGDSMF